MRILNIFATLAFTFSRVEASPFSVVLPVSNVSLNTAGFQNNAVTSNETNEGFGTVLSEQGLNNLQKWIRSASVGSGGFLSNLGNWLDTLQISSNVSTSTSKPAEPNFTTSVTSLRPLNISTSKTENFVTTFPNNATFLSTRSEKLIDSGTTPSLTASSLNSTMSTSVTSTFNISGTWPTTTTTTARPISVTWNQTSFSPTSPASFTPGQNSSNSTASGTPLNNANFSTASSFSSSSGLITTVAPKITNASSITVAFTNITVGSTTASIQNGTSQQPNVSTTSRTTIESTTTATTPRPTTYLNLTSNASSATTTPKPLTTSTIRPPAVTNFWWEAGFRNSSNQNHVQDVNNTLKNIMTMLNTLQKINQVSPDGSNESIFKIIRGTFNITGLEDHSSSSSESEDEEDEITEESCDCFQAFHGGKTKNPELVSLKHEAYISCLTDVERTFRKKVPKPPGFNSMKEAKLMNRPRRAIPANSSCRTQVSRFLGSYSAHSDWLFSLDEKVSPGAGNHYMRCYAKKLRWVDSNDMINYEYFENLISGSALKNRELKDEMLTRVFEDCLGFGDNIRDYLECLWEPCFGKHQEINTRML